MKKFISLLTLAAMLISLFAGIPVSAAADAVVFEQTYETNCTATDMKTAHSGSAEIITEEGTNNKVLKFYAQSGDVEMGVAGAADGIASDVFTIQFDVRAIKPNAGLAIAINNPYQSSLSGFGTPYLYLLSAGTFYTGQVAGSGEVDDNWYTFLLTVDASTFRENNTTLSNGNRNIVTAKYKLRGASSWTTFTYSGSLTNAGARMVNDTIPANIPEGISFATMDDYVRPLGSGLTFAGTEYHLDNIKVCLDPEYTVTNAEESVSGIKNISFGLGADSMQRNLAWFSESDATGTVKWQKADEMIDGAFTSAANTVTATRDSWGYNYTGTHYNNKATITGLEPNTKYFYQLTNGDNKTKLIPFETGDGKSSFSFAYVADPQIGANQLTVAEAGVTWGRTLNQIATDPVFSGIDFMMSGGDQINSLSGRSGDQPMYDAYLDHDEMMSIANTGVLGNHDNYTEGGHYVHFNEPNLDENYGATYYANQKLKGANYYFVYDSMLCIVLNLNTFTLTNLGSAEAEAIDKAAAEEHIEYIEKVLEETKDNKEIKWKVILQHQSPYGGSYHNDYQWNNSYANSYDRDEVFQFMNIRKYLIPAYYENGIDLVLSGHDHTYTRTHIIKPQKDTDGNYTAWSEITPYNNTSGSNYYTYEDGTTSPTFVNWTDLDGVTYDKLKVSSKPVKVTNPDGVLHVTGSTASGSQCNDNTAPNHYAAVSLGHEAKLEALGFDAGIRRQAIKIDVTPKTLTITNYGLGGNTSDVNPADNVLDTFTIEKTDAIAVQGIALEKTSTTIAQGMTETLAPVFTPAEPDNKNITWTSNNTSVATVDQTGKVTAVAKGNATITATTAEGGYTATCAVTVIEKVAVTGITLDKTSLSINKGSTKTLYATITPSNASVQDITWTSSNEGVATVSANGSITGVEVGTATITATTKDGGKIATCSVTITKIPVTKVSFAVSALTVNPLNERTMQPMIEPSDATFKTVSYVSSNPSVVEIDGGTGKFKALKKGSSVITATADGISATYTVNVVGGVLFNQDYEDASNTLFSNSNYGWSRVQEEDGNWVLQLKRDANTAKQAAYYPAGQLEAPDGTAPLPIGEYVLSLDICNMSDKGAPIYALHAYQKKGTGGLYTLNMQTFDVGEWYNVKIVNNGGTSVAYRKKANETAYTVFDVATYSHNISSGESRLVMWLDNWDYLTGYPSYTEEQIANAYIKLDNVKISSEIAATGISLDKESLTLGVGSTAKLSASMQPSNATDTNITYTSSNPNIATVDQKGNVTAKAFGTATITVTTVDGGKTDTCAITVSLGTPTLTKTATNLLSWSFEVVADLEIESGKVYVGAFDANDILISVGKTDFNTEAATAVDVEFADGKTASYFKAFIWNSKLTPLTNAVRLENE
ncbi:MAG: Ig-like domain-containing protein [Clostridia bacterium]|nr:Ig-like domain-containing protein [Clostridia bacterium]